MTVREIHQAKKPDNVLEMAKGGYESLFIIGYDSNGNLDARGSTNMKSTEVLWLIELFKVKLLNGDYGD